MKLRGRYAAIAHGKQDALKGYTTERYKHVAIVHPMLQVDPL